MDEDKRHASEGSVADLSGAIERLMANPDLISMVAQTVGIQPKNADKPSAAPAALADTQATAPTSAPAPTTDTLGLSADSLSALAPLMGMLSGAGGSAKGDDHRACLLRALKPYVNRSRAEAIDSILQILRLAELLRHVNLQK